VTHSRRSDAYYVRYGMIMWFESIFVFRVSITMHAIISLLISLNSLLVESMHVNALLCKELSICVSSKTRLYIYSTFAREKISKP
jgi:hypothetical protein